MITKLFDPNVHDRSTFDCGQDSINTFFKQRANSWQKKAITKCWVLEDDILVNKKQKVKGFYTLSMVSITESDAAIAGATNLPSIAIPAALIGHLGVSNEYKGNGLGQHLLIDACNRAFTSALGCNSVVVDAINPKVAEWYESFGFVGLSNESTRLAMHCDTFMELINEQI